MKSYGQIAYETYCITRDWKSFNGTKLPSWEEQRDDLKGSWERAAEAVIIVFNNQNKEEDPLENGR